MLFKRRIQLAAVSVVLVNGVIGLTAPERASAGSCPNKVYGCELQCPINIASCQAIAAPGCTAIGEECLPLGCQSGFKEVVCEYE